MSENNGDVKKASEILAEALEGWGPNGENWCKHFLETPQGEACLIGGITKAAFGRCGYLVEPVEAEFGIGKAASPEQIQEAQRAERLVWQQIQAYMGEETDPIWYAESELFEFNDSQDSFDVVREVVCGALKNALDEEAPKEESAPGPSCRIDPATGMVVCD